MKHFKKSPYLSSVVSNILRRNNFNFAAEKQKVVLFPGNGIGPEISDSVVNIFDALKVPIEFETHEIYTKSQTEDGDLISPESINRLREYKYGLKGPF